ncbi:MAG: flagellar hook-length control protein FliK [Pseudomonadota bacterium]
MTDAAKLLGGPQVVPARGPGKDQPPLSGEKATEFGDLLAAVEQLADLQAEGIVEIDANGLPVPVADNPIVPQGEAIPDLGSLIAKLEATEPELLEGEAGRAQTFVPTTLGQRGRSTDFRPLDLTRSGPKGFDAQPLPLVTPAQPKSVSPPNSSIQPGHLRAEPLVAIEALQVASETTPSRGEPSARLPDVQAPKIESTVSATPRLESALQQHASQETSNPVVRQLAQNIQTLVRGDLERMRFDLYPEELGRVSIQMQKTSGATKIVIVTETPQAFEALQRGASGLQLSLSQAGFDPDEMTFEQQSQRGERETAEDRRERDDRRPFDEPDDDKRVAVIRPAQAEDRGLFL